MTSIQILGTTQPAPFAPLREGVVVVVVVSASGSVLWLHPEAENLLLEVEAEKTEAARPKGAGPASSGHAHGGTSEEPWIPLWNSLSPIKNTTV